MSTRHTCAITNLGCAVAFEPSPGSRSAAADEPFCPFRAFVRACLFGGAGGAESGTARTLTPSSIRTRCLRSKVETYGTSGPRDVTLGLSSIATILADVAGKSRSVSKSVSVSEVRCAVAGRVSLGCDSTSGATTWGLLVGDTDFGGRVALRMGVGEHALRDCVSSTNGGGGEKAREGGEGAAVSRPCEVWCGTYGSG